MRESLREVIDRELADVAMRPELIEKIENKTIHRGGKTQMKRKISLSLAVALAALAVMVGVAFATGVAQSIIQGMKILYDGEDESKYEAIDEIAQSPMSTRALPEVEDGRLMLHQSYYDGEQIILSYSLTGNNRADFGFGPGHEKFSELQPTDGLMIDFERELTPEDYQTMQSKLASEGRVGFIVKDMYVGDHLRLADGTDLPERNDIQIEHGYYYAQLAQPLPEAARNVESLDIAFRVKQSTTYYYRDQTGEYYLFEPVRNDDIVFTVPRSTEEIAWYDGGYSDSVYEAQAEVKVSPINVWVKIAMTVPEIWDLDWNSIDELRAQGIDYLYDYQLVADGEVYPIHLQEDWTDSTEASTHVTYQGECAVALEDVKNLSLRPVYALRGEAEEEEISLIIR